MKKRNTSKRITTPVAGGRDKVSNINEPSRAASSGTSRRKKRDISFDTSFSVVLAALIVATIAYPGENLPVYGSGHFLNVLWFAFAAVVSLCRFCGWVRESKPDRTSRRECVVDRALTLFFVLVLISTLWHCLPGKGSIRFGLNALFVWFGCGAMFFLFRRFFADPTVRRALTAIVLCMGLSQAMLGYYQYVHEIPQMIRAFRSDPRGQVAEFAKFGWDVSADSNTYTILGNRILTATPGGTYPLTNSLAGLLAPVFVFFCGIACLNVRAGIFVRKNEDGSRSGNSRNTFFVDRRAFRVVLAVLFSILSGGCLFLTHSRTALLAAFCGLVLLGIFCLDAGHAVLRAVYGRMRKSPYLAAAATSIVLVAIFAVFFVADFAGRFDSGLSAGARRSLGFRLEYWQSTSGMIRDMPLLGCGPGNFKQAYTKYKLPAASEEIADPHNFVMEIAATVGIPAMLAFSTFLCCLFLPKSGVSDRLATDQGHGENTSPTLLSQRFSQGFSSELFEVSSMYFGAVAGFFVLGIGSQGTDAPISVVHVVILGISFLVLFPPVFFLVRCVSANGTSSIRYDALIRVALVVLLVNLLASGGITYTSLAVVLWFFAAILMGNNDREKSAAGGFSSGADDKNRRKNKVESVACAIVFTVLTLGCCFLVYRPCFMASTYAMKAKETETSESRIEMLEQAMRYDRVSAEISAELSRLYLERARRSTSDRWLHRALVAQETALRLAPISAVFHLDAANDLVDEYRTTRNVALLDLAIKRYEKAASLYPNHAKIRAPYALTLFRRGDRAQACIQASDALELDRIMPHEDQKLPSGLREELRRIVASERESAH